MKLRIDVFDLRNVFTSFYQLDDSVDPAAAKIADAFNASVDFGY